MILDGIAYAVLAVLLVGCMMAVYDSLIIRVLVMVIAACAAIAWAIERLVV